MQRIQPTLLRISGALLALIALVAPQDVGLAETGDAISRTESDRIVAGLRKRYAPFFAGHQGIRSLRQVQLRIVRDGKTENVRLQERRTDFFYRKPERTILSATKDGQTITAEQARGRMKPRLPPHPILDKNSASNYRLQVQKIAPCGPRSCYVIQVTPLRRTERHITGTLYVDRRTLTPTRMRGTPARLPTGGKRLSFDVYFGGAKGFPFVTRGTIQARFHVPLIVPDTTIVSRFQSREHATVK